ncbi:MAG: sensor domain-containing diguanylate cyclase, partial [bacterium]
MNKKLPRDPSALRLQAENAVALAPEKNDPLSLNSAHLLVHELRVHQIELEMQNEELRQSRNEAEISKARYIALYDQAPTGYITING